jgi:hypothetical protein
VGEEGGELIIPGGRGRGPRKTIDSKLWSCAVCCRIVCLRLDICCRKATVKNSFLAVIHSPAPPTEQPIPGSSREAAPNAGLDARPLTNDVRDGERERGSGWEAEIMTDGRSCRGSLSTMKCGAARRYEPRCYEHASPGDSGPRTTT